VEALQNLFSIGFQVAFQPMNLFYCLLGVMAGTTIGVLPGLGPSAGLAVLLPLTFGMDPTAGIILLAGIYYGSMYGGSLTSIMINTPGAPSSVATAIDGYQMTLQGRVGPAMGMDAFASFIGGTVGIIIFTFLAPMLAGVAIAFGPPEYFALMILGLTALVSMAGDDPIKGYISAFIGLFLAMVGLDLVTGAPRFTYGSLRLMGGFNFIPVTMGLFGISEIIISSIGKEKKLHIPTENLKLRKLLPSWQDWKDSRIGLIVGSLSGSAVGVLPGAGATIASFIAYDSTKKLAKNKEQFGKGAIAGVAAPESANSSASILSMVPMLTLGVPGSASTAIMMGALLMFGMRPGPLLFDNNPEFVWGLVGSMYIGNFFLIIASLLLVPIFARIVLVPRGLLNAVVMAFILIGAYSLDNSMFTVFMTLIFGVVGVILKFLKIPVVPLVLALVLGRLMEISLRQSLIMSQGSAFIFFSRPISGTLMAISIIAVLYPFIKKLIQKSRNTSKES